jgi:tRNA threonylcarbamoyladenosine dehydratase
MDWLNRTRLLIGDNNIEKLKNSHILVVGLGGVGAYAAEMLCRAGIGTMTIVDADKIELTNINRQLPGLISNIGKEKATVMAERLRDINPEIELTVINEYIHDDRIIEILKTEYDYVVDAIDTLSPKTFLIYHSVLNGLRIVSSMGSGGKMDPEQVKSCDISKSYNCNLARMLRKRLSKLGIKSGVKVVFSPEEVPEEAIRIEEGTNKKSTVGTISYMPPLFGCHIASVVIRDLIEGPKQIADEEPE